MRGSHFSFLVLLYQPKYEITLLRKSGDWKSRLHKQSPPSETKNGSGNLQSNELNEIFTTRVGGFCLCSRDFNRQVIIETV
jgi:hypothetical protein